MQKKPMGKKTFKMKMEKRLNVTLRQGYVCKVVEMLNKGMIPTNIGDILHIGNDTRLVKICCTIW